MRTGVLATVGAIGIAAAAGMWAVTGLRPVLSADGGDYTVTNEKQHSDAGDYVGTNEKRADGGDYTVTNEKRADGGDYTVTNEKRADGGDYVGTNEKQHADAADAVDAIA